MGRPLLDLTGQKFNKLTVIKLYQKRPGGGTLWECRCDCGNTKITDVSALRKNRTTQCKVCHAKQLSKRSTTHGHNKQGDRSPTYESWACMIMRATNPNLRHAKHYFLRGISVCEEWKKFENFLKDMGERPPNTTLDRIDPDGNYEPKNCRWADNKTQALNKRKT